MSTLRINITKDVLQKSMYCGLTNRGSNCAIAVAVRDIFPHATVGHTEIYPFYGNAGGLTGAMTLPEQATLFIREFDNRSPHERVKMEEFSFDIELSPKVINSVNIDEVKQVLQNHPSLELV